MIRHWVALLVGVGISATTAGGGAFAADIPPMPVKASVVAPAPSWSGCYVGGQVGGAYSDARWNYNSTNAYNSADPAGPRLVTEEAFRQLKPVVGAQAGCNMSYSGPWMLGMEIGWIATPMDRTKNTGIDIFAPAGFTGNVRTEISSIVSATARVGYSFMPDWLVYAKGGYAAAYIELRGNITPSGADRFTWNDAHWHSGWTAGAGVEYRLFRNVTVGAEYNYYRFAGVDYFGAQGGVGDANQVRLRADADVHTVMARLNFYDPSAPLAKGVGGFSGPSGTFSSFLTNSVKYASWTGSRGPNVFSSVSGKGDQVYSPFTAGIDYVEANNFKLETRAKGGYVYTRQGTPGQTATYEGPIDTQTSVNVVLLSFESIRPQFGVAMNLPTGTSYLPNNQRFTRVDPDLVEVGAYGAGFNINPTAGLIIGIDQNTAVSFSAGYAWNGKFVREAIDLNAGGGFGAFDLKRWINPGDVFTANANVTKQLGKLVLLGSFAYTSESRAKVDGVDSGRTGAKYTANLTATYQIDDQWALATNASWNFAEKNEIIAAGFVSPEPKNSNSHVVIGSIEPSYRATDRLRLAASYSFLWRDENFYDQIENQFIPAKQKHTAGTSATYALSETASLEVRGSYSWIHQDDSAILPVTLVPPSSAPQPPGLDYRAWGVSTTANLRF
jgi:opacity protein-like surface antigen